MHRFGRPVEACTEENVQRVNDILMTDRRLTVRYVAGCCLLRDSIISDEIGTTSSTGRSWTIPWTTYVVFPDIWSFSTMDVINGRRHGTAKS